MKICVFCGSSQTVDPIYLEAARTLGTLLASKDAEIYYGAGNTGLMGVLSAELLKNKCHVRGVIPEETLISDMVNHDIDKIYTTKCLSTRKKLMLESCDVFIVLPGGIGTLDEFLDVIAYKQINPDWKHKKCILINTQGYFDLLLSFLQQVLQSGFMLPQDIHLFEVVNDVHEVSI